MKKECKVIFVIGAARSGTSFLHGVLSGHENVVTPMIPKVNNKYLGYFFDIIFPYFPLLTQSFGKHFRFDLKYSEANSLWSLRLIDESDVLNN
ncbi:MAG: hypothetical protein DRN27_08730, partial [Thermoplasmata archaeon]